MKRQIARKQNVVLIVDNPFELALYYIVDPQVVGGRGIQRIELNAVVLLQRKFGNTRKRL